MFKIKKSKKLKIIELEKNNMLLKSKNNTLIKEKNIILSNIDFIDKEICKSKLSKIYIVDNDIFIVHLFETRIYNYNSDIYVEVKILNQKINKSITELYCEYDKRNRSIWVISIDTLNSYGNCGHGSRAIKMLIEYSKIIGVEKIKGELFLGSDFDKKLKNFYLKNGFNIKNSVFEKTLDCKKSL